MTTSTTRLDDTAPLDPRLSPGGRWKHFKHGDVYEIVGTALHSETGEPLVVYRRHQPGVVHPLWARPASMWFDEVKPGVRRFTRVEADPLGGGQNTAVKLGS